MWIASKYGFFSVVQKGKTWEIRARKKHDLQNLIDHALAPRGFSILTTPEADYRWRIVLHHGDEVQGLFTALASTIDYKNFKDMIKNTKDQADKLAAYHRIWAEMNLYQEAQPGGKRKWSWDEWAPAGRATERELFPDYEPHGHDILTADERADAQAQLDAKRKVEKMLHGSPRASKKKP